VKHLPELLLPWFAEHRRNLPWREDREPYHIWLSEIMLQQTRVEAVKPYYKRFLAALPDIAALAHAPQEQLLKLWEGLGYYSRVRNLQKAARQIVDQHGGIFPQEYDEIRALSGIGNYTAGAIASICFEQPTPAVDGNVLRVLTRYLAWDRPINDEKTKREAEAMLSPIYPKSNCGDFTQALMELGATVCVPNGAPLCSICPLRLRCLANKNSNQLLYPKKAAKKPRKEEHRTVFVLQCGDNLALYKRPENGLLAGLWQFPDVPQRLDIQEALAQAELWGLHPSGIEKVIDREHIFTHVHWFMTAVYLKCSQEAVFEWFSKDEIRENIGLPTAYRQFLEE